MNFILPITFIIVLLTNIFILFEVHTFWLSSIFSFISFLIIPGILLSQVLRLKTYSFWETLAHAVGLSLFFCLFGGLLINELLPLLGISEPLALTPVLISFDLLLLILFYLARPYMKNAKFQLTLPPLKPYDIPLALIPLLFPILAVLGAISLNNGGTNLFTMLLLFGIGVYVLTLVFFHKKISPGIFPTAIFFISLSLLFMTSLRSWYILGHDIQSEYYVFQLTKMRSYWNIDFYKDAYNACLSITILPTILSSFFKFNDIYIYKVVFQILFAICPVVVYLFIKKFTTPIIAFIAAFFFISFPTFLNDMPMLNRQESGFIFFSLLILVLFKSHRSQQPRSLLYIYGAGIVVSHYSTNYITVGLLTFVYLSHLFLRTRFVNNWFKRQRRIQMLFKHTRIFSYRQSVSLTLLVFLLLFTFFWNSLLTQTSSGLTSTIIQTITNIGTIFRQDNKSADIAYSLFFSPRVDNTEYVNKYVEDLVNEAKKQPADDFYTPASFADYRAEILPNELLPLTKVGQILQSLHIDVFRFNYLSRQFFARMLQLLILIGLISLFFYPTKKKIDAEFMLACCISVFFIALLIILPELSRSYGLLRLFQQLLMFLSLPLVFGSLLLLRLVSKTKVIYFAGVIAILFFLSLSGFMDGLTGGYYPQVNLTNQGLYYNIYYIKRAELTSMTWLKKVAPGSTVQADIHAMSKLLNFGYIYSLEGILPQIIRKSAYVYVGEANIAGRTVLSTERSLTITFPIEFLENHKDLIYNNGLSRIYK